VKNYVFVKVNGKGAGGN